MSLNPAMTPDVVMKLGAAVAKLREASDLVLDLAQDPFIRQDNPEAARELRIWWESELFHHGHNRAQAIIELLATGEWERKE